jgi:hypothetical protein
MVGATVNKEPERGNIQSRCCSASLRDTTVLKLTGRDEMKLQLLPNTPLADELEGTRIDPSIGQGESMFELQVGCIHSSPPRLSLKCLQTPQSCECLYIGTTSHTKT